MTLLLERARRGRREIVLGLGLGLRWEVIMVSERKEVGGVDGWMWVCQ